MSRARARIARAPCSAADPFANRIRGLRVEAGYRLDMLVDAAVVVEVKAVETLSRLHEAQILTYLKLSSMKLGYLLNFNAVQLRQGLRRFVR
jgi:GxxExxY protein